MKQAPPTGSVLMTSMQSCNKLVTDLPVLTHLWCRWEVLNPASMKQALVEGSEPIPGIPMYEQGQGKLNLINSMNILKSYQPKASIVPRSLDFTDCPYMWPFCTQPIYANALPLIFNATVLNAMALTGKVGCSCSTDFTLLLLFN